MLKKRNCANTFKFVFIAYQIICLNIGLKCILDLYGFYDLIQTYVNNGALPMITHVFFFFHVSKSVLIVEVSVRCECSHQNSFWMFLFQMYYRWSICLLLPSSNVSRMCSFKLSNSTVSAVNLYLLSDAPPLLIPCFALPFSLRLSLTQERLWRPFWSMWRTMSPKWSRLQGEPDCLTNTLKQDLSTFKDSLWYCHSRFSLSNVLTHWEHCV